MNAQLINEKQDLTYLSWSIYPSSSGTAKYMMCTFVPLMTSKKETSLK